MIWREEKLVDICNFQGGSQPPKKEFKYEKIEGYIRFLQIRDFGSDKNITYIPNSKKNRYCEADDILIGRYGASVGKILKGLSGAYNVALMKVIPNEEKVFKPWFYYYLNSPLFQKPLLKVANRSAQNGFNKDDIGQFVVQLPPIAEQKVIVTKLDSTFKEIDNSKSILEDKFNRLSTLLNSYIEERLQELKKNFPVVELAEVIKNVQYGTSKKCLKEGEYPVLRMGNMKGGKFDLNDLVYLNDQIEAKKYQVIKHDVFFNRTNSALHVGKSAIWEGEEKVLFAGYLIKINYDKSKIDPYFLNFFLNLDSTRKYGYSVMSESINQANINGTKLKQYPFVKADLNTQRMLSLKFRDLEKRLSNALNITKKSLDLYAKLREKILARELEKY